MQIAGWSRRAAIALFIAAAYCRSASALNPSLDINQYAHNSWTIREGFFKSSINSIAQTQDGYLWLGTESGLLRFDGVRAVPWQPPRGEKLPSNSVLKLYAGRDGTVWIGTSLGLASWNRGKLARYPDLDGYRVLALAEDRHGTVWAGAHARPTGRLCAIRSEKVQCFGDDGVFASGVFSVYPDDADNLWVGGPGLWQWEPGAPKRVPIPNAKPPVSVISLAEIERGRLLVATGLGIHQVLDGKGKPYPIPAAKAPFRPDRLLRDRDGGLWIGTLNQGLVHVHRGRTDLFSRSEGLSGDPVADLFEDREGSIWVVTSEGIDRFREVTVSPVSVEQGLSSRNIWSVLATRDGSVWMGSGDGLNRWKEGRVTVYREADGLPDNRPTSLVQDAAGGIWLITQHGLVMFDGGKFLPPAPIPPPQVFPVSGDAGSMWISGEQNLVRLVGNRPAGQFAWSELGAKEFAIRMIAGREPGAVWLGFYRRGVAYFRDGRIRQWYGSNDGLAQGSVRGFKLDRDGSLWAAMTGGLSLIRSGRVATLTSQNGLPCETVDWMIDDGIGSTWLYTACGLVRLSTEELDAWKSDSRRAIHPTVFDSSEGIVGASSLTAGYGPRVTQAADGKLWFVTGGASVRVIDPRHLPVNQLPPPVHIEQVIADHNVASDPRLPARTRDLEIDYTALSFVAPERNRFKYQLEGYDRSWQDVGNRRQAFYNNLRPRTYRFHVIACNNSGLWNETGDTLELSIAPAWNQTTWFYASCVAVFLAVTWGLYRLRLYQIAREFNAQLDGRVDERLRVARDLHDTMLQTFQAGLIQMQAGYNLLSRRPEKAAEAIEKAITTSASAIAEGREAIQSMRSSTVTKNDLARALRVAGDQMAAEGSATFEVRVQGSSRDVHPILRDEVYRIALEGLRNAFKHAEAKAIEAEIVYGDSLRVRVRDDGKGIDPAILKDGRRTGHYGLPGMRERADRIGGKLDVWSGAGAGTEIQLSIPGNIAFGRPGAGSLLGRFRRKGKSDAAAQS